MLIVWTTTLFFLLPYCVLILYYRHSWIKIRGFELPATTTPATKVTIVIPARNEAANIGACLQSIVDQTYPRALVEVRVIDDHSTDATPQIIGSFAAYGVHLVTLKDYVAEHAINSYKKKAIEIAVQQSTGELIVTTDADCMVEPRWLEHIVALYETSQAAFIAMPVRFNKGGGFLGIFQALDFMTLQGITGASVTNRSHSMCNGANLAYEKKAFMEVGGFKGIDHIASGDDMLLMHKIFERYPSRVFFLKSREVIVHTNPMETWKKFINQRIRWASKADKYDDKRIFAVLLMVYFFNVWILALAVMSLFLNVGWVLLTVVVCKTLVELYFLYPVAAFFRQQGLLWWFPLAQPVHIFYTVVAGWLGKFGKYSWKERTIK